jgi:hypothetical protein
MATGNEDPKADLKTHLIGMVDNYEILHNGIKESPVESKNRLNELLGEPGVKKLYEGIAEPRNPPSTQAREKFINKLIEVINNGKEFKSTEADDKRKNDPAAYAISMEKLLDKEGVKLYKAAIEEERNSTAFRDAVLLQSTKHYDGPKWKEKMVLWVGGPSASGKSYGAEEAVKKVGKEMMSNEGPINNVGNNVVSVDGGVERETSQMRQIVLQAALKKGYPGIKDLHELTKLDMKKHVQNAALTNPDLSLVIPCTFTTESVQAIPQMRQYQKDPTIKQAFSEVIAEKDQNDRFQNSVARMGNSRAWSDIFDEAHTKYREITMNNRDIGCESKKYGASGFSFGKTMSKLARKLFMHLSEENKNRYYAITNDLMFIRPTSDGKDWMECDAKYKGPVIKLAARDFAKWQEYKKTEQTPLAPSDWLKQHPEERSGALITHGEPIPGQKLVGEDVAIIRNTVDNMQIDEKVSAVPLFDSKSDLENSEIPNILDNMSQEDILVALVQDGPVAAEEAEIIEDFDDFLNEVKSSDYSIDNANPYVPSAITPAVRSALELKQRDQIDQSESFVSLRAMR